MSRVSVAVLSDDRLFSEGVARLLGEESTVAIVDPAQFPDILLVDSRMDGMLHSTIKMCMSFQRDGGPAVVFIAAPDDDEWALQALAAGARGILPKSARGADMLLAIRMVSEGTIWARRRVVSARLDHLSGVYIRSSQVRNEELLSLREREVFHHAASGLGNKELAGRLQISEATVKVHLTHIFQKLGVRGRAELAAAYHGIMRDDRSGRASN